MAYVPGDLSKLVRLGCEILGHMLGRAEGKVARSAFKGTLYVLMAQAVALPRGSSKVAAIMPDQAPILRLYKHSLIGAE